MNPKWSRLLDVERDEHYENLRIQKHKHIAEAQEDVLRVLNQPVL